MTNSPAALSADLAIITLEKGLLGASCTHRFLIGPGFKGDAERTSRFVAAMIVGEIRHRFGQLFRKIVVEFNDSKSQRS